MSTYTRAAEDRERLLLIGTWILSLGSVFLVREIAGWDWTQAWPLFVIMLGCAGAVSAVVKRHHSRLGIWAMWWPIAVVVVGILLLASTTGALGIGTLSLAAWWPIGAIALGIWFLIGSVFARENNMQVETLAVPLEGLTQAEVRLNFGGGELRIGPAAPGTLLSGHFDGGVIRTDRGPGRIELRPYEPGIPFFSGRALQWDVGITPEIPVDLRLDSGANRSTVDLSALRIRRLELHTGMSETTVRLPASGATSVHAETGMASMTLEVPAGVSARIRSKMGLGATRVDETRFPRSFDGWASPDYETSANRVEIDVEGGFGSVQIA